jgi:autophagy-related protein 33
MPLQPTQGTGPLIRRFASCSFRTHTDTKPLQGLSYTLSTLTLPTLLTLPTATSGSRAFTNLATISLTHARALAGISSSSFLLAYLLSPRGQRHPYLLWTTIFVASSGLMDVILRPFATKSVTAARTTRMAVDKKGKGRQMDASYEVLGHDSNSEGTMSGEEMEEDVNGEEVRHQMEGFMTSQIARTVVAGVGFAMSVIGIWGDGAGEVVIIEM